MFSINHSIVVFYLLEEKSSENIACNFFDAHHFQMAKQKVYLLTENIHQLSGLNIAFVPVMLVLIDIYSS